MIDTSSNKPDWQENTKINNYQQTNKSPRILWGHHLQPVARHFSGRLLLSSPLCSGISHLLHPLCLWSTPEKKPQGPFSLC
uniref:Uncharacterized protein n=1 Tax=Pyxicephalus adspersus TaxID=30357 RepID=A0AAV3AQP8_PYXAD|nr:TPA: hypothetical protein GDO54_010994 [Pyxicephalus adspersus]